MRIKKYFNGAPWMFSSVINLRYSGFLKMKRVSKEAPPAWKLKIVYFRSSRPECSVKEVFLETSQNLQENTCVRDSFFNKVVDLRPATLLKKRLRRRCFFVNFATSYGISRWPCQRLFFNKVVDLRSATLLKRGSRTGVFLWFLRNI